MLRAKQLMTGALLIGGSALVTGPAAAEDTKQPAIAREISRCRTIPDTGSRLACFDAVAARFEAAVAAKQLTILDAEGVRRTKRSLFGFSLPSVGIFGRNDNAPEFTEIDTTIRGVAALGYGKYEFRLDDGARWQTTDAMQGRSPRTGDKILIRKASLGAYFIRVGSGRVVKGKRVG